MVDIFSKSIVDFYGSRVLVDRIYQGWDRFLLILYETGPLPKVD